MNAVTDQIEEELNAARALMDQGRIEEALPFYAQAMEKRPNFHILRLYYARALELSGHADDALANYYRAMNDAQSKGRWLDEATTPREFRDLVLYAMRYIDAGRRRLFDAALAPFRDITAPQDLARVEQSLAIYLGEQPPAYGHPKQRSKFLHFPALPTPAFFPRELFPWYAELEKNTDVIRDELLGLLAGNENFEPFLDIPSPELVPQYLGGEKPNWNAFFFYRHGKRYDENCERCPKTSAILESLPLVRIPEHAPEICFSVLTPGTHILAHHGSTNTRLVTHLPLIVPPNCAISVGGEVHEWVEGQCVTFDDTFEHEAWNRSDKTRAVLILDVWNPYLTELEKRATTALIGAIRAFNRKSGIALL